MEDLGGIVIFVLFLAISLYNRYAKQGSQPEKVEKLPVPRTPQWPGPVARPLSGPVLRPQARPRAGQEASGDSVPEALGVGEPEALATVADSAEGLSMAGTYRELVDKRYQAAEVAVAEPKAGWMDGLLSENGLAQAVVTAEVLSRPKALRGRRRLF